MKNLAVQLENVSKLFPTFLENGKRTFFPALCDISLEIEEGSFCVGAGANGSGKSVLMSVIAGLTKPSDGNVWTKSKPGLIFQDASAQILGDTALEDVSVGLKNMRIKKELIEKTAKDALEKVRLLEKAENLAEFLSGGEKRRLAVASVLAMQREIVIFDEPYANLDYPGVLDVNRLLEELKKAKKTVILLTHELEKCLALADRFFVLSKGKIVYNGLPTDALLLPLEKWSIRSPLVRYESVSDLIWK